METNVCVKGKSDKHGFLKTFSFHIPYYEVKAGLKILYKIMTIWKIISRGLLFLKGKRVLLFTILESHGLRPSFNLAVPWFSYCQHTRLSVSSVAQTKNRMGNVNRLHFSDMEANIRMDSATPYSREGCEPSHTLRVRH